ncbi:MAG: M10 family metallopeptidase C-terminal domain-containing protein [Pseudomonadota bacterium]|nr:M10 family metallopeptidase C-terminal domain-containing protein [Pseudomonadota bacterium]
MTIEILHSANDYSCQCAGCLSSLEEFTDSVALDASLDPLAGGTFNNKPIWTPEQIAAHFNRTGGGFADGFNDTPLVGRQNNIGDDNSVITFGFFNTQAQVANNGYVYSSGGGLFGLAEYFNFAPFSAAQREAAREAMQGWDDVVAVSFREASADDADMNFGNLASAPTTQAYARIPNVNLDAALGGQVREIGGDSWISASQASNFQLDEGGYGLQTLAHEIGHSIGISHPGGYNAAPGLSITYAANAEYAQDTRAYSIMSYFNGSLIAGTRHFDFHISGTVYAGAPLIHDILAAQRIYGADMTTRTGDTVYGFNSNAGRDQYDFTRTPAPISAIWDAGGIDTIDASGYATTQLIDLTAGSLSSIGGVTYDTAPSFEKVNANRAAAGFPPVARATYDANMAALLANPVVGRLTDNFGIAYGVTIENAIGGSGSDTIIGNEVDNILTGNAGADTLTGKGGNDTLDGGSGSDIMIGGIGNDLYLVGEVGDVVTELGDEGIDTVSSSIDYTLGANLENLVLTGVAVSGTGNALNNVLAGNTRGNRLDGGAGNDRLIGGDGVDFLTGGAGNDVFVGEINQTKTPSKSGLISLDVITDFTAGDKIDLSALGDFNFKGSSANKGAGDLTFKVYDSVNGAEKALGFDIDGIDGPSSYIGKVTIVFGDIAGGGVDFAIALLDRDGVTGADFYDRGDAAALATMNNLLADNVAGRDFAPTHLSSDFLF